MQVYKKQFFDAKQGILHFVDIPMAGR